MRVLNVQLPDDLHTQMRLEAIRQGKTLKQFVADAIEAAVKTKKEQTR